MLPIVILAGGLATRLRPISETIPKSLVIINDEPFIYHQLRLLRRQGIKHVYLLIGYLGEQVVDAVGDGKQFGLEIHYINEGEGLLGTGGAIVNALPQLPESFFMMYGDSYLTCNFKQVEQAFIRADSDALMTVFKNKNQWDRSNVIYDDGKIITYDKSQQLPTMQYIDYGLSCFKRDVFHAYVQGQQLDLVKVYQHLLQQQQLAGYEVTERFYEVGSFVGLEEFAMEMKNGE